MMVYLMAKFTYHGSANFHLLKSWLSRGYKLLALRNKNASEGSIVPVF